MVTYELTWLPRRPGRRSGLVSKIVTVADEAAMQREVDRLYARGETRDVQIVRIA